MRIRRRMRSRRKMRSRGSMNSMMRVVLNEQEEM